MNMEKCKECCGSVFSGSNDGDDECSASPGGKCTRCQTLKGEVTAQVSRCKSLVEINSDILARIDGLNGELQVLKQKLKEGEWSNVGNRGGKPRSWSDVVSTNNFLQKTRNRFSALQEVSETPQVVRKPVEKVVKGNSKKKKVLLLSCSQVRLCSNLLQENLGDNFEISSIVKLNARLKDVVCDAEKLF